jgi:hypothetical protein
MRGWLLPRWLRRTERGSGRSPTGRTLCWWRLLPWRHILPRRRYCQLRWWCLSGGLRRPQRRGCCAQALLICDQTFLAQRPEGAVGERLEPSRARNAVPIISPSKCSATGSPADPKIVMAFVPDGGERGLSTRCRSRLRSVRNPPSLATLMRACFNFRECKSRTCGSRRSAGEEESCRAIWERGGHCRERRLQLSQPLSRRKRVWELPVQRGVRSLS